MYKSRMDLDAIDLGILNLLKEDASLSLGDMAKHLGVSTSTVHKRMAVLVENNIIEKFSIAFDPAILGLKCVAFIGIELERYAVVGTKKDAALKAIADVPGVMEVHECLAPFDLILKVRTEKVETLRNLVSDLNGIKGVANTNTILTTNRIKENFW